MNIIVAGGTGFLGRNLIPFLLKQHHNVLSIDISTDNVLHHKNLYYLHHDITSPLNVENIPFAHVDQIYNLACFASPTKYTIDPIATLLTNIIGTKNMLDLANVTGATMFQSSSSEAYGDPLESPQSESYFGNVNTTGPRSCYDEGKRASETLCYEYHNKFKTSVKIARLFNVYGPNININDGRAIPTFIKQALRNEDVTVQGNGNQTRSFCYIDDAIEAMTLLMDTSSNFIGPINIGNPEEQTIHNVATAVIKACDSKSAVVHTPLPQNDPIQRVPDISLANKLLQWYPTTSFENGIGYTITTIKEHMK